MRLLDCTISAFGTLCDRHIDFSEGITVILEENGFGKTTLAAFIKAMFYGLPTARRGQTAENNERVKYYPWNNSNFGGRLTFEAGGKTYRIVRSFDRTTATNDSFQLIDAKTGAASGDFGEDIGRELFGVDEEGFLRSTFSNGTPQLSSLPSSIRSKISNRIDRADDMDDFEAASKRLTSAIKELDGKSGALQTSARKIQAARSELERCKTDILEYQRLSACIAQLESERKTLEKEKSALSQKLVAAQGAEAAELKRRNYNRLLQNCEQLKNSIAQIEQKYSGSCPDNEKIAELNKAVSQYREQMIYLSVEEKKENSPEYRELSSFFEKELPADEEIRSIGEQLRTMELFHSKIEQNEKTLEELNKQLSNLAILNLTDIPDEAVLNEMRLIGSYASSAPVVPAFSKTKKGGKFWLALSALLLVAGLGLCFVNLIAGIIVAAVGAVALIACALLSSVRKMMATGGANAAELIEKKQKMQEFLVRYGFSPQADVNAAVDKLKMAHSLFVEMEQKTQDIRELKTQLAETLSLYWSFMDQFGGQKNEQEAAVAFEVLKRRRDRYLNEVLPTKDKSKHLAAEVKRLYEDIVNRFQELGVCSKEPQEFQPLLDELKKDAADYQQLKEELSFSQCEAQQSFEHDEIATLPEKSDELSVNDLAMKAKSLEQKLAEISDKLAALRLQAQRLSYSNEESCELEELIESESEKEAQNCQKLASIKLAAQYLLSAKNELSKKYAGSVGKSFERYSSLFLGGVSDDVLINPELTLSVEREGIGRDTSFFSSGQRSVMDVCLRLSLIDAMFEKEKPFLILDDPFSSLDEQNLQSALALLKNVSKEQQILYLTCHPSRTL